MEYDPVYCIIHVHSSQVMHTDTTLYPALEEAATAMHSQINEYLKDRKDHKKKDEGHCIVIRDRYGIITDKYRIVKKLDDETMEYRGFSISSLFININIGTSVGTWPRYFARKNKLAIIRHTLASTLNAIDEMAEFNPS